MVCRCHLRICFLFLVAILGFAAAPASAAPRVAVISAEGADAGKVGPLVEIDLQQSGCTLVDRQHLDQVLHEQQIQQLLSADDPAARAKLGQVVHADFLVFMNCPDEPTRQLEVITCETTRGIRLARSTLPRADSIEKDAAAAGDSVAKAIAKSAKAGLKIVAVAPWSSDDLTMQFDARRAAFRRLVEAPLSDRDDIVLVEFAEARALQMELDLAGQPNLIRNQPLILSGRMKHASVAPDAQVTVGLELKRGTAVLGSWTSGQVDVPDAAAALPLAANGLVSKASGGNPPQLPNLQAKDLADRADSLQKLGFYLDAAELYDAALLLDPRKTAYHLGAARSLDQEIRRQMAQYPQGQNALEEVDPAVKILAPICGPLAERCLAHLEIVYDKTFVDFQFFLNCDFTGDISRFVPHSELWDSTCRVMEHKKDRRMKDQYANQVVGRVFDTTISGSPADADAEVAAQFAEHITDVCPEDAPFAYWLQRYPITPVSPQLEAILKHMEASANPGAIKAASAYRAHIAEVRHPKPTVAKAIDPFAPLPATPGIVPDWQFSKMVLPIDGSSQAIEGWNPAGLHADLVKQDTYYAHLSGSPSDWFQFYFLRDDGFAKKLGTYIDGTGPGFDGKYVWWTAVENNTSVVKVFDPVQDKVQVAGAAQGVPPDELTHSAVLGVSPGKAYIIGSIAPRIDELPTRTWLAEATISAGAAPSIKILHQWRERAMYGNQPLNPNWAFDCSSLKMLPGPIAAKKPTPNLYITCQAIGGTFVYSPDTGSIVQMADDNGRRFNGIAFHDKVYHRDLSVYDPALDMSSKLPLPAPLTQTKDELSTGVTVWNEKILCYAIDKDVVYVWWNQEVPPDKWVIGQVKVYRNLSADVSLVGTSLFGLISGKSQVQLLHPELHPEFQQPDWRNWLQKDVDRSHDPLAYFRLADSFQQGSDPWFANISNYIKYGDPSSIDRAQQAVIAANLLMQKGDYDRAAYFAAEAAKSGSEWSVEYQAWAAEGQGKWTDAERYIREVGDRYGHPDAWLAWCARTGHGDLAAAKAQCLAGLHPDADDPHEVEIVALYSMYTGDDAKAQPTLKALYEQKRDSWAALHAGIYASAHGNVQARDQIFANLLHGGQQAGGPDPFFAMVEFEADSFKNNAPLGDKQLSFIEPAIDAISPDGVDNGGLANLYYFAGRFLILQGQTDQGIRYLKHAAGYNSYKSGRTLAAIYLRQHNIEVPKPGMK